MKKLLLIFILAFTANTQAMLMKPNKKQLSSIRGIIQDLNSPISHKIISSTIKENANEINYNKRVFMIIIQTKSYLIGAREYYIRSYFDPSTLEFVGIIIMEPKSKEFKPDACIMLLTNNMFNLLNLEWLRDTKNTSTDEYIKLLENLKEYLTNIAKQEQAKLKKGKSIEM